MQIEKVKKKNNFILEFYITQKYKRLESQYPRYYTKQPIE